jgi:putative heme iron utilization protein
MNQMAQVLLADKIDAFRALDPASQKKMLGQKMRSQRHLLVLDNMESITGSSMAIRNTLSNEEQQELKAFLAELLGGDTLVLLGSRSNEEWLAEGSGALLHQNDIYRLLGLDDQAASALAEKVLERHLAEEQIRDLYRESDEFKAIMKMLDGYPLPIQVVLANLANQTPAQILKALKEGGTVQDPGHHKTESLMLCIEYSHSNLAPEDQKMLMTLAPFTGVICQAFIDHYIEYLRQQPALAELPFHRFNEVMQRAQDWGLITTDQMAGYLRLQPVLPYFLRIRLSQETEVQQAVENAYRTLYDDIATELLSPM